MGVVLNYPQSVEELAMGDECWQYQGPIHRFSELEGGEVNIHTDGEGEAAKVEGEAAKVGVEELRGAISKLARRENR